MKQVNTNLFNILEQLDKEIEAIEENNKLFANNYVVDNGGNNPCYANNNDTETQKRLKALRVKR